MDKCKARVRVRDAHEDNGKANSIKETHVYYICRCLQAKNLI